MTAQSWGPGTRVLQYEISGRLGAGGMGEVFRARDLRLDRPVAIKVLSDQSAGDPEIRERFEREARAVAALVHPGIVGIFEMPIVEGRVCLVLELLDGESLRVRIDRGPLSTPQALDITRQIAEALEAAHDKGIVHRDLKPENVFLTTSGRVKLLDFGIAQWKPIGGASVGLPTIASTVPGRILGTPGYLAPEQLRGEEVTPQADLFSLGCVVLEMLTGKRAFLRESAADTLSAVLTEAPAGLPDVARVATPQVAHIVTRLLEKPVDVRFRSALELVEALRSLPLDVGDAQLKTAGPPPVHYDVLVIGSGPAGQRGAIGAAKRGKRVAIIDRLDLLGGASVHSSTLPSKTMREAVLYLTGYQQRTFYGRSYQVKDHIDVADLSQRILPVVQREHAVVQDQLRRNGVDLIDGLATFRTPHTVEVAQGGRIAAFSADRILVACGSRAGRVPEVPIDNERILDVDGRKGLGQIPKTMIVVGAGAIGLEFASMATALNTRVTLVDQRTSVLEFADDEIVESLLYLLRRRGATLRLGERVVSARRDAQGVTAELASGKRIHADALLYAVGRHGNADRLRLGNAGLEVDARGRIAVNAQFQTAVPHIYAAGDVVGFPALASVSMEQGRQAVQHMLGEAVGGASTLVPYCIYTIPEIAMVGQHERGLTDQNIRYEVGVGRFEDLVKGQMSGDDAGFLKLLFEPDSLRILGAHVIGTGAGELIHIAQSVMTMGGTLEYFRDAVFSHPSWAEVYKIAALNGFNRLRE
jgi:NAD(P) transhydrogenase